MLLEDLNSDDLVKEMLDEMDSTSVLFHDAIQTSRQHGIENVLFCYVEGKDDLYYYPTKIENYLKYNSKDYKYLISQDCGNKDKVKKLYTKLVSSAEKDIVKNSLFFIDRDFEKERTVGSDIYITPMLFSRESICKRRNT